MEGRYLTPILGYEGGEIPFCRGDANTKYWRFCWVRFDWCFPIVDLCVCRGHEAWRWKSDVSYLELHVQLVQDKGLQWEAEHRSRRSLLALSRNWDFILKFVNLNKVKCTLLSQDYAGTIMETKLKESQINYISDKV